MVGLEIDYHPSFCRRKGHSSKCVAALLSGRTASLFATTDDRMKETLAAAGFVKQGRDWQGQAGQLSLWLKADS